MTTVVATRDRMVCDTKVTHGTTHFHGKKVFVEPGVLIGVAGDGDAIGKFLEWFRSGADEMRAPALKRHDSFEVLVLNASGLYVYADSFHREEISDAWYAIGSGSYAALAALHCGKSAEEAVEIAARVDVNTGLPIESYLLNEVPKPKRRTRKGVQHG